MTMRVMSLNILHVETGFERRELVKAALNGNTVTAKAELVDLQIASVKSYLEGSGKLRTPGLETWELGFGWLMHDGAPFDLVLLHTSNRFAADFLKHFVLEEKLSPERVLLYSGVPDPDWPRPEGCAAPILDNDMLECLPALASRWAEGKKSDGSQSVADVLAAIHEEAIWRQCWFTTAFLAAQPGCRGDQIARLFKDLMDGDMSHEEFRKKAFWRQRDRVSAGPDFETKGQETPIWRAIRGGGGRNPLSDSDRNAILDAAKGLLEMLCK